MSEWWEMVRSPLQGCAPLSQMPGCGPKLLALFQAVTHSNTPQLKDVWILEDEVLDGVDGASPQLRARARKFVAYVKLLRTDASALERVQAHLVCPITLCVPSRMCVSLCCGRIFDENALLQYVRLAASVPAACPMCRVACMVGSSGFVSIPSTSTGVGGIAKMFH